jgi:voltage-gated potassium channel
MVENASKVLLESEQRASLRSAIYVVLDNGKNGSALSKLVDVFLVSLIVVSIGAVILESIPALESRYEAWFFWIELFTVLVFTAEYIFRVWSCVENPAYSGEPGQRIRQRLRFAVTPYALIDLIAILPFYLVTLGLAGGIDMRFLRAVRLLRILKLTRYSSAFDMLVACCRENKQSLGAAFFVLMTVMLLAASGIYFFERESQPVAFGSIPAAMWWAFATLTTVGYGDVTPVTAGGKVFGALITVIGVGMVALPTGILASGYAQQIRLRSNEYEAKAEEALDDGILSPDEISELEVLRKDLGIGKHTASQILDTRMVKSALHREAPVTACPHCGGRIRSETA